METSYNTSDDVYSNDSDMSTSFAMQDLGSSLTLHQTPLINASSPTTLSSYCFEDRRSGILKNCKKYFKNLDIKLLLALDHGGVEDIRELLTSGANPNATCCLSLVTACHLAALKDNDSLSLLIKAGANTFRTDSWGRTPLHLAAWGGHHKQVALLLDVLKEIKHTNETLLDVNEVRRVQVLNINHPCDLDNEPNLKARHTSIWSNDLLPMFDCGWTALHAASARAHYKCVVLLLEAGADTTVLDISGRTPLDIVGKAYYSKYKIDVYNFNKTIKALIRAGGFVSNINEQEINKVNTSMHVAVELESEEAIQELLYAGAAATSLNTRGLTAMHICVEKQLKDHLQLLAKFKYFYKGHEDPIDIKDDKGLTVLHAAVKAKWGFGVRIALEAGASVYIKANNGDAPIHTAAMMGDLEILQLLITFGKSNCLDLKNSDEHTALFVAIINNHIDAVKLLIENHHPLRVYSCHNVLHIAAAYGRVEILRYLLKIDVTVTACLINERYSPGVFRQNLWNTKGAWYTPVIYAVANNHPECVLMLLKQGAQIDIDILYFEEVVYKKVIWTTALNIAAINNYLKIAQILIQYDSRDIHRASSTGVLPLHEACIHGNKEMITLLIKEGADLSSVCRKTKTPISLLMNHLPQPTVYMEEILDSYIFTQGTLQDKECKVKADYTILAPGVSCSQKMNVIKALIDTGNRHGQRRLLQHPLIESYLYLQWKATLPVFYIILALYGLFALSVNVYIVSIFHYEDKNKLNITNETIFDDYNLYPNEPVPAILRSRIWKYMIFVTVILMIIQELMFLIKAKTFVWENLVKFGALGSSLSMPLLVSWRDPNRLADTLNIPEWKRLIGSVAMLLIWLEMMFLLSKFPTWGIYAFMFGKVTTKVLKVLLTFGFLIIGFALCFMIQFRAEPPFEGIWAAITKTIVMMTSEYDYTSTINEECAFQLDASIVILRILFVIFIVIASIVLINLMVGVAVNDVTYLETEGKQTRLMKQVDFLMSLQSIVNLKIIRKILPKILRETFSMSKRKYIELNPNDPTRIYGNVLPKRIEYAIIEKAQLQIKKTCVDQRTLTDREKLNEMHHHVVREELLQKTIESVENMRKEIENVRADQDLIKQLLQNVVRLVNKQVYTDSDE